MDVKNEKSSETVNTSDLGEVFSVEIKNLPHLKWMSLDCLPNFTRVINNGHTVIARGNWEKEWPYITGGPLHSDYVFNQMHFHWGGESDHVIQLSKTNPLELHATFLKISYFTSPKHKKSIAEQKNDGIVIVTYSFQIQKGGNTGLEPICKALKYVKTQGSTVDTDSVQLDKVLEPFYEDYYMYSSTYSNIFDVIWLVCRDPLPISINQLDLFRNFCNSLNTSKIPIQNMKQQISFKVYHINPATDNKSTTETKKRKILFVNGQKISDEIILSCKSEGDVEVKKEKSSTEVNKTNKVKKCTNAFKNNSGEDGELKLTGSGKIVGTNIKVAKKQLRSKNHIEESIEIRNRLRNVKSYYAKYFSNAGKSEDMNNKASLLRKSSKDTKGSPSYDESLNDNAKKDIRKSDLSHLKYQVGQINPRQEIKVPQYSSNYKLKPLEIKQQKTQQTGSRSSIQGKERNVSEILSKTTNKSKENILKKETKVEKTEELSKEESKKGSDKKNIIRTVSFLQKKHQDAVEVYSYPVSETLEETKENMNRFTMRKESTLGKAIGISSMLISKRFQYGGTFPWKYNRQVLQGKEFPRIDQNTGYKANHNPYLQREMNSRTTNYSISKLNDMKLFRKAINEQDEDSTSTKAVPDTDSSLNNNFVEDSFNKFKTKLRSKIPVKITRRKMF